ncbi:MAG: OsmC family protein [Nitrososphaeria archaeon]
MPTEKKVSVEWQGRLKFVGRNEEGLSANFDVSKSSGGDGEALSPMETLLACLGACEGIAIVRLLEKMKQNLTGYHVELTGVRRDEDPSIYTSINLKYIIRGRSLNKEAVERAIRLAEQKYCSVRGMIENTARVSSSYEIIEG